MRFWAREIAGWVLVVLSLYVFYRSYTIMTEENSASKTTLDLPAA